MITQLSKLKEQFDILEYKLSCFLAYSCIRKLIPLMSIKYEATAS